MEHDCGILAGAQAGQRVKIAGQLGLKSTIIGQNLLEQLVLGRCGVIGRAAPHVKDFLLHGKLDCVGGRARAQMQLQEWVLMSKCMTLGGTNTPP